MTLDLFLEGFGRNQGWYFELTSDETKDVFTFLGVDGKSDTLILSKLFQMQWHCAPNKGVACRASTRFASLPFLESLFTETSHVPAKNSDCFQGWTICRWYSSSRKIAGPEQPFPWHGMITKESRQHDQDRVTASICLNTEYPSTLSYQSFHHSPHFPPKPSEDRIMNSYQDPSHCLGHVYQSIMFISSPWHWMDTSFHSQQRSKFIVFQGLLQLVLFTCTDGALPTNEHNIP